MKKSTKRSARTLTLQQGFTGGNWEKVFQVIADERNALRAKAKSTLVKDHGGKGCLVEHYAFNIHSVAKSGKVNVKPTLTLGDAIPRTKSGILRAAQEYASANPGKPFQIIYTGWYDGSLCLPRYNAPENKTDRIERMVTFAVPIYTHTDTQATAVTPSDEDVATKAVRAALRAQV